MSEAKGAGRESSNRTSKVDIQDRVSAAEKNVRVAIARRILAKEGCDTGVAQHVSERDQEDRVWVSPLGFGECCQPNQVAAFSISSDPVDADAQQAAKYASDYVELYRRRDNVNAVVHSHSFWAMVLCTLGETIGMYNVTASLLNGHQAAWTDPMDQSASRGLRLAEALGGGEVLLMKNHGIVIASETLERATVLACVIEQQARLHLEARERGGEELSDEHLRSTQAAHEKAYVGNSWAAHLERLYLTDPDIHSWII